MEKMLQFFTKKALFFGFLLVALIGNAQNNFTVFLANGAQTSPSTFEVDIMLTVVTPTAGVRLSGFMTAVNFDTGILNGGLPCTQQGCGTWTYVGGKSAALNALLASVNTYRLPTGVATWGHIRTVISNLPAASSIDIPSGTYTIGRYRFTNTVPFTVNSNANLWLNPVNNNPLGSTNTIVSYYPFGLQLPLNIATTTTPFGATLTLGHTATNTLSIPLNNSTSINEVCAATGSQTATTAPSCIGNSNGSSTITMSPTPTNTFITYTVDGGFLTSGTLVAGSFTVLGLSAGSHTIVVTGNGTCTTPITVSGVSVPAGPDPGPAQQHFTVTLANMTTTTNTLEVDIVLIVDAPTQGVRLGALSTGINYNPAILNGGTPCTELDCGSWEYIAGTRSAALSTLNATGNRTRGPEVAYPAQPYGHLRVIGNSSSVNGVYPSADILPGTYTIGRYRFTNTTNWAANTDAQLWLCGTNAGGLSNTIVNSYPYGLPQPQVAYTVTAPACAPGVTLGYTENTPLLRILNPGLATPQFIVNPLQVAPNPFNNTFQLNFETVSNEQVTLKIYDMLGKLIDNRNVEANAINTVQLGKNYQAGIYNVNVSQGEKRQNIRVIKN